MPTPKPVVSIVIPVFNEEHTLGKVIQGVKETMKCMGLSFEVLVVDDCSTDNSLGISLRSNVRVLQIMEHRGKGYALRAGFRKVRGEIIVTIDSDGSHSPEELPKLVEPILSGEADFVIGSRFLDKNNIFQNKFNKAGVQLLNILVKALTGKGVSDSQSGYRAFKSVMLKFVNLKSNGYEIESEMLVKAFRIGVRTKEVPIKFIQRTHGKSKLDPLKDGVKIFTATLLSCIGV
ncbi:MAG: glycosyltransferase family 2 protein [Candidatus Bathyarchaeia archaeon]